MKLKKFLYFIFLLNINLIIRVYLQIFGFANLIKLIKSKNKNNLKFNTQWILSASRILYQYSYIFSCLSIAASAFLLFPEKKGYKIVIGIAIIKKKFNSHAWIERTVMSY